MARTRDDIVENWNSHSSRASFVICILNTMAEGFFLRRTETTPMNSRIIYNISLSNMFILFRMYAWCHGEENSGFCIFFLNQVYPILLLKLLIPKLLNS
jgi:hypothetical protein